MLARLVSNCWPQGVHPPWPPKVLDYKHEPLYPANFKFLKLINIFLWPNMLSVLEIFSCAFQNISKQFYCCGMKYALYYLFGPVGLYCGLSMQIPY